MKRFRLMIVVCIFFSFLLTSNQAQSTSASEKTRDYKISHKVKLEEKRKLRQSEFHNKVSSKKNEFREKKSKWSRNARKENLLSSSNTLSKAAGIDAIPSAERAALIALYNSTDGDNWDDNSGWKTPPLDNDGFAMPGTENTWEGITVVADHVVEINLSYNNLSGTIPPEIGDLGSLEVLYLAENYLTGIIPVELGDLSLLEELVLNTNELSGSIPAGFADPGDLPVLWGLDLGDNYLEGNIPSQLGNLGALVFLYLDYNNLSGGVPEELGGLSNLEEFNLYDNNLDGTIAPGIADPGDLSNLLYFDLAENELTGSIPAELGNLAALEYLDLSFNNLTGSIPAGIADPGDLPNLQYLELSINQLTGAIPASIANLNNLEYFAAVGNQLDTMPEELGDLNNLEELYLFDNKISSIPAGMLNGGDFPNLYVLDLYLNEIDGTIPIGFENLPNLTELYLEGNKFSGEIPTELMNIAQLHDDYLDIRWNALYTNNGALRTFLAAKQEDGDWESTQTVAPTNVRPGKRLNSVSYIDWDPILYTDDNGGYDIYYSPVSGGPYTFHGSVSGKTTDTYGCKGLPEHSSYYFVVKARTNPHNDNNEHTYIDNNNTVISEYSNETYIADMNYSSYPEVIVNTGANIDEGGQFTFSDLILKSYAEDAEVYTLIYSITTLPLHGSLLLNESLLTRDNEQITFTQNDIANGKVKYMHNGDDTGSDSFSFIVSDIEAHSTEEQIFNIEINVVHDVPVIGEIPLVTMQEDKTYILNFENWLDYVSDEDSPDSTLICSITSANENIHLAFPFKYICIIVSAENYFGTSILTFCVSDSTTTVQKEIELIIEPVNDLPAINGLATLLSFVNGEAETIELTGRATDIETPDSLLVWSFSVTPDSVSVSYNAATKVVSLSAKDSFNGNVELTIVVTDADGGDASETITITVTPNPTGINDLNGIPTEYTLYQNYPNPFNPSTTIRYGIPVMGTSTGLSAGQAGAVPINVSLCVYDILGNEVATLQDGQQSPGFYERMWNAANVSSGIYLYMLRAGNYKETRKLVLMK